MDKANGGAGVLTEYSWQRQPRAAGFVAELVGDFLRRCPEAERLAERMRAETGTRFIDWVDSIDVSERMGLLEVVQEAGFAERPEYGRSGVRCFVHDGGVFPWIFIDEYSN